MIYVNNSIGMSLLCQQATGYCRNTWKMYLKGKISLLDTALCETDSTTAVVGIYKFEFIAFERKIDYLVQ